MLIKFTIVFSLITCGTLIHEADGQCLSSNDDLSLATDTSLSSIQDFNIDLFRRVVPDAPEENFIFSPYSVWNALVLAYLGSSGNTSAQFREVLRVSDKISVLRKWRELEMTYNLRPDTTVQNIFTLSNRIYFDKEVRLKNCIRNILHNEIRTLDFTNQPVESATTINQFVNTTTRGHITRMVSSNDIKDAHLVLINAAYFKGIWNKPFDASKTVFSKFTTHNKEKVQVEMMTQFGEFRYAYDDDLKAEVLELPYAGENIAMYIFLPYYSNGSSLNELTRQINSEYIDKILSRMQEVKMHVYLPKFSIDTLIEEKLLEALYGMGLRDPFFSYKANFIDFSFYKNLKLDHSVHKAFINVNEEGTEAGAATAFIALKTRASEFRCNRPFMFVIRDNETHNLLFMGTLRKPKAVQGPLSNQQSQKQSLEEQQPQQGQYQLQQEKQ